MVSGKNGTIWVREVSQTTKQLSTYGKAMDIFQKSNQDAKQLPIKLGIYCPQNGFWQEWDYRD